jgi:ATP-dependent Lhr-like helicase
MDKTSLDPHLLQWFVQRHGAPTAVQAQAWPAIARGDHVLATAPTGSGKTLAASLMALQALLLRQWPAGQLSVVYVSPLKALSSDVQRNLLTPLAEIGAYLRDLGQDPPRIRVALRTGDTAQGDRSALRRHGAEILVTTPESLHILLVSASGRQLLGDVKLCILDEIHAVAESQRGTLLMSAVEELERLVGRPVQRVALSATVNPLQEVAEFVGGWHGQGPQRRRRPVTVIAPSIEKRFDLQVLDATQALAIAQPSAGSPDDGGYWPAAAQVLRQEVLAHRSTLLFANSRRSAERLAREINEGQAMPLAWAHHGSLAQELRRTVEARLKDGELRAVCATSSLELGIDVGAIDEVVLVGAPRSVASALQRVGRAGHQVGATSVGRLMPTFGRDLLRCAVLVELMRAGTLEPLKIPRHPADVLAQLILARVAAQDWQPQALFDHLRGADAFDQLPRETFDQVVQMLRGHWADLRLRELQPRLEVGPLGELRARRGVATLVMRAGGVIADRGYFKLVLHGSGTPIGELDEEFVWERQVGDVFAIGAQSWQVVEKTRDTVSVAPGRRGVAMAPFWRSDPDDRGPLLSNAMADWLKRAEPLLESGELADHLAQRGDHTPAAVEALVELVKDTRKALGALPTRERLIIELCKLPEEASVQALIHAPWGGVVLRPLGLALRAFAEAKTKRSWQMQSADDCVLLRVPEGCDLQEILGQFLREPLDPWLEAGLASSAALGLQFRYAVGTALVIPRSLSGKRTPLFLTRERSKQLLKAVAGDGQFPLLADAMRVCLREQFDLPLLRSWLQRWRDGELELRVAQTQRPSPMADGLAFLAQGELIYETDRPFSPAMPLRDQPLADQALDGAVGAALLQPMPAEIAGPLRAQRLRCDPAWAPQDLLETLDTLGELSPLTGAELQELLGAAAAAQAIQVDQLRLALGETLLQLPWGAWSAASEAPVLLRAQRGEADTAQWRSLLHRYFTVRGPVDALQLPQAFGVDAAALQPHVQGLVDDGAVLQGVRVEPDDQALLCDRAFAEQVLRRRRRLVRSRIAPSQLADGILLKAMLHGVLNRASGVQGMAGELGVVAALERLQGLPLDLALLESDILPARVAGYRQADLDRALADHGWVWRGYGDGQKPQVLFARRGELHLWQSQPIQGELPALAWFTDPEAAYSAEVLLRKAGGDRALLARELFAAVWAGQVHADGFASLRKGLALGFAAPAQGSRPFGVGRGQLNQALVPWAGPWQRLPPAPPQDLVDRAENQAYVALIATRRLGVAHRALWLDTLAGHTWRELLPALRRLDWSGQLIAGAWLDGLQGLQLAEPTTALALQTAQTQRDQLWWVHSTDPCAPSSLGYPWPERLPVRAAGSWLVLRGAEVVAAVRRGGRELDLYVAPDAAEMPAIAQLITGRPRLAGQPRLTIDVICGVEAARSPYRPALQQAGLTADFRSLTAL